MKKRMIKKGIILGIIILFFGANVSIGTNISTISKNNSFIIQSGEDKQFMIGRITNLQIEGDAAFFNPINIWIFGVYEIGGVTKWFISHTRNEEKNYYIFNSDFKGILTKGFICGVSRLILQEQVPAIWFLKYDTADINTLTLAYASPVYLLWNDIQLMVNETTLPHGMTGFMFAGDTIDLTAIAGIGAYRIRILWIPSQKSIGFYDFTAAS